MENIIIVCIMLALTAAALRASVKHFKGQGGCCGGGSYKARPKKLNTTAGYMDFNVEGMHCRHCVNRVMEEVNSMEGLSARVKLKQGRLRVYYEKQADEAEIIEKLHQAGYEARVLK